MKASTLKRATIALTLTLFAFTSCNTIDEATTTCATCNIIERTDMIITGDIDHSEFNQSEQSDASTDLITYNFYGNPSEYFDFIIHLSNGNKLIIKAYDAERMNPWQQVGQPYNIYPLADQEDKLSYVNVELRTSANEPIYATNLDLSTPPAISLDVFKLLQNDGETIQARLRDMTLYSVTNPNNTISINGTFVGAVTFE